MWPFKTKTFDTAVSGAFEETLVVDNKLQEEFLKINQEIIRSFDGIRESMAVNGRAIMSLDSAIKSILQSVAILDERTTALDQRLRALEAQLSFTGITFRGARES